MNERELFEKHIAKSSCGNVSYKDMRVSWNGDGYNSTWLDLQWRGWQASANREGYKLVPVEPTREMLRELSSNDMNGRMIYKAMIGAVDDH